MSPSTVVGCESAKLMVRQLVTEQSPTSTPVVPFTLRTVAAEAGAANASAATTATPAHTPRPERSLLSTGLHLNMTTRGLSSTQKERTPTLNTHAIPLHERREGCRHLVGLVIEKARKDQCLHARLHPL